MQLALTVMSGTMDESDNGDVYVSGLEVQTMQVNYWSDRSSATANSRIELKEKLVRELAGSNHMAAEELRVLLKTQREAAAQR